ncbi:polysaccharide biosynthesis tyrosine autokinase [Cellulophaga sp. F20128]|uniref:GumC family protein n=1 Tax=Cellulophaga sp. F20128 TaxID=2926413 RepID=UPI001FF2ABDA|nr:tyrosine-protein kinase family protein [Cellulophaga sp. F20128]MCK0158910.1 polysaccharide biosynthesis tyrosine autokinase [Cellulophaga sp. F20128]
MDLDSKNSIKSSFDIKEIVKNYTKNWIWFVLALVIALSLAYVNIRYTTPQYSAIAKIQILSEQGSKSELSVLKDLGGFSGDSDVEVLDEILSIKSRSNFIEMVDNLNLNVRIFTEGRVLETEVYKNPPFTINFLEHDSIVNKTGFSFYIDFLNEETFGFSKSEEGEVKKYSFGSKVLTVVGDIVITPNLSRLSNSKGFIGKRYKVLVSPIEVVASGYRDRVSIAPTEKGSRMLDLYLTDNDQQKAKDILNELIKIYNNNASAGRKAIADKTSNFINDRIEVIASSLSGYDQEEQDFRSSKGVTDIESEASFNYGMSSSSEQELEGAKIRLGVVEALTNQVQNQDGFDVLPSGVIQDPSINDAVNKYNELVITRDNLLKNASSNNPAVKRLNDELSGIKQGVASSLANTKNALGLQVNSLSKQVSQFKSKLYVSPINQRKLTDITRKQNSIEGIYLFLLQRREESQIAFASATPKLKTIDYAYNLGNGPVSPIKRNIYFMAIVAGLFIPFGFIYVKDLLDNKIHNKIDLEKLVGTIPVLAEIPKIKSKIKLVQSNDRSVLAESLRILRTNIDYLLQAQQAKTKNKNNIVFITSSVSGEGKTLLASNLALIFANTNKKVLLIGADIRNPKLYTLFDESYSKNNVRTKYAGLTEYLTSGTTLQEIIRPSTPESPNLDIIYSGMIPPNPAEILMDKKMEILFNEVSEKYDYVIVDTAPMVVVTDTLLISKYASQILYVTRAGATENKVIQHPINLLEEGKINNLSFVVNHVNESDLGYGGKYGYGYGVDQKKWWQFFKK